MVFQEPDDRPLQQQGSQRELGMHEIPQPVADVDPLGLEHDLPFGVAQRHAAQLQVAEQRAADALDRQPAVELLIQLRQKLVHHQSRHRRRVHKQQQAYHDDAGPNQHFFHQKA